VLQAPLGQFAFDVQNAPALMLAALHRRSRQSAMHRSSSLHAALRHVPPGQFDAGLHAVLC
jgi:hypothetical protein